VPTCEHANPGPRSSARTSARNARSSHARARRCRTAQGRCWVRSGRAGSVSRMRRSSRRIVVDDTSDAAGRSSGASGAKSGDRPRSRATCVGLTPEGDHADTAVVRWCSRTDCEEAMISASRRRTAGLRSTARSTAVRRSSSSGTRKVNHPVMTPSITSGSKTSRCWSAYRLMAVILLDERRAIDNRPGVTDPRTGANGMADPPVNSSAGASTPRRGDSRRAPHPAQGHPLWPQAQHRLRF